jgi:NADH dehydrogenase
MARDTLRRDFRTVDTRTARILLVEAADRVLPQFPARLSERANRSLRRLGVTPLVEHTVVDIDERAVTVSADGATEEIAARTVVWAAGVVASALAGALASGSGADVDRAGRIAVGPDLTVPGHPEVFALGDMAQVHDADGKPLNLPGLAPVAMQQGRYAARAIVERLQGRQPPPFRYRDKGNLATIGRAKAVAEIGGLQLSGFFAWLAWLFVHLFYLIGLQNRLLVFIRWTFSFVTHGRGARLITGTGDRRGAGAGVAR